VRWDRHDPIPPFAPNAFAASSSGKVESWLSITFLADLSCKMLKGYANFESRQILRLEVRKHASPPEL
jgi:hypothetical protein